MDQEKIDSLLIQIVLLEVKKVQPIHLVGVQVRLELVKRTRFSLRQKRRLKVLVGDFLSFAVNKKNGLDTIKKRPRTRSARPAGPKANGVWSEGGGGRRVLVLLIQYTI